MSAARDAGGLHRTAHNLCLHYVEPAGRNRRLAITPEQLRAMVEREQSQARTAATLEDYLGERGPGDAHFTISFDDAQRSLLTYAAPVLASLGVRPTLFVPTGYVGTSDEFLTWDELRALRDLGWILGAHSITHPRMSWRLYDEDTNAHAQRLLDECTRSRAVLERELGVSVRLFAYPYGEAPAMAREAVRAAGYEAAFTVRDDNQWDGDTLAVPRIEAMEAHGLVAVREREPLAISVIVPACDRVEILCEVVRRLTAQSYPSERYEVLVVDDGSRQDLAPAFAGAPDNVRLIAHAGESSTFRAGQARQRGADEARFETLAFLDADIAVGPDFLWALDWVHQRVPGAVVLGYLSGYNLHDMGHVHTLTDVRAATDLEAALAIIPDRSREPTLRACLDNLDWLHEPWRLAYTGNMSVPRSLLAKVGGFASDFVGWGLEDIDLGYRLHRGGGTWVFSRFAVGYHLVDLDEAAPRNPYRAANPTRDRFAGYLTNLEILRNRHGGDPAIQNFYEQTLRDVDETCSHPHTVGIEMGGADPIEFARERMLGSRQPGGTTTQEILDRIAYAEKVGAASIYVLGGEPADHPGFLELLRAAKRARIKRVVAETNALPFADLAYACEAHDAGLDQAVLKIYSFDAAELDALAGEKGTYDAFIAGYDNLARAGIFRSARVIVVNESSASLVVTLARLRADDIRVDEVLVLEETHVEIARAAVALAASTPGALPQVRLHRS